MTEEFYKKAYEKERKKNIKLVAFLDALESSTNYFDDFCDCIEKDGEHDDSCRTMDFRKDFENALS